MDLTQVPGEDTVTQVLEQAVVYPLAFSIANLTGDPDKYSIVLNLTTTRMNFGYTLRYIWWRRNLNFDTDEAKAGEWYVISNTTTLTITDSVSGHSTPKIEYQTSVHPANSIAILAQSNVWSFDPKPHRWWLPLVIALPIALLVLILLIAGFVYARRKRPEWFASTKKQRKPKKLKSETKLKDLSSAEPAPVYAPDEGIDPNNPKKYTVDIDYLFTGARRVQVKEGNPSSLKPPEDYDPEADAENGNNNNNGKPPKTKRPWIRKLFPCLG
eukprot:Phypoly_transcript_11001.p1 GENE.Phypoly_transcript_11001~~Phypoly_transcript_11001.p1  ORF type:complete len:270 (+),score=54.72 Phypoly_transcript_11001:338-1147(+)